MVDRAACQHFVCDQLVLAVEEPDMELFAAFMLHLFADTGSSGLTRTRCRDACLSPHGPHATAIGRSL